MATSPQQTVVCVECDGGFTLSFTTREYAAKAGLTPDQAQHVLIMFGCERLVAYAGGRWSLTDQGRREIREMRRQT